MPTPATRTPVRIARGTYSNLNSSILDLQEGEICYATDQNKLYIVEGGALTEPPYLPLTGGTMTGAITFAAGQTISGYGAIDTAQTWTKGQRGEVTTLTDAATIAVDFADSNNFAVTLGASRTLGNPSNQVAGQCGSIFVIQDGTGGRTLSYSSDWEFAGGTAPTLSTAANAVDRIDYIVRASGSIHAVLTKAFS